MESLHVGNLSDYKTYLLKMMATEEIKCINEVKQENRHRKIYGVQTPGHVLEESKLDLSRLKR